MTRYYKKAKKSNLKKVIRYTSLGVSVLSCIIFIYIMYPFLTWKLYLEPVYASEQITLPIPKGNMVTKENESFINDVLMRTTDSTDVKDWFPEEITQKAIDVPYYSLSIPTLSIKNAIVATEDTDLNSHLVQYGTQVLPPDNGTTVIFGHSTLPQWFKATDYKTIFAKLYTIKKGDTILITVKSQTYTYTVKKIRVVKPSDLSMFQQESDTSYLTLVTCTPPGTTWKRLVVEAELHDGK